MIKVELSTVINVPAEDIFLYTSNFENDPTWIREVEKVERTSDGPIELGSTFVNHVNFLGKTFKDEHEIIEYEANERLVIEQVTGPVPFKAIYLYLPSNGGTRFSVYIEAEPGGFFKLAAPLVSRRLKSTWKQNLQDLKRLLETSVANPSNQTPVLKHEEQL